MIATTPEIENYLAQFERRANSRAAEPPWLASLRKKAIERFAELGFPTTRHEEWKYTSVQPIAQTAFQPGEGAGEPESLSPCKAPSAPLLTFCNGRYAPRLSRIDGLPDGVVVTNLTAAPETHPEIVERHLAQYARYNDHPFVALNTALMQDGGFIYIPEGVLVEKPILLVHLCVAGEAPVVSYPRTLIVAEESSQATFVETYTGPTGEVLTDPHRERPSFTNAVTEIVGGENAVIDHYKVNQESEAAYHVAMTQIYLRRNSNFVSHSITLGGALTRNDINTVLDDEGIEATLNGLVVANGRQHVDNHTTIDHAKPHCTSHELYKGIWDGHATGVFNGKIFVRQDAQKTDARQTNQNLLLSQNAVINTKPQLEIFADDVRCTHGATVGQLDEDALFYLRTRGIGKEEARALLTYAFTSDILARIKVEALRTQLEELLASRHSGVQGLA